MSLKLTSDEQASIDLILNQAIAADQATMYIRSIIEPSNASATGAVQQLLGLLGTMPVEEPALDLATRTMALIDRTAAISHPSANDSEHLSNPALAALAAHAPQ